MGVPDYFLIDYFVWGGIYVPSTFIIVVKCVQMSCTGGSEDMLNTDNTHFKRRIWPQKCTQLYYLFNTVFKPFHIVWWSVFSTSTVASYSNENGIFCSLHPSSICCPLFLVEARRFHLDEISHLNRTLSFKGFKLSNFLHLNFCQNF